MSLVNEVDGRVGQQEVLLRVLGELAEQAVIIIDFVNMVENIFLSFFHLFILNNITPTSHTLEAR